MPLNKLSETLALIPARAGSKRVPNKNIRVLGAHPLIAYTIGSALRSNLFKRVIVSTDSAEIAAIAGHYGAEVPFLRPAEYAEDNSPDIEWVRHLLKAILPESPTKHFSILRPTSPFRQPETIQRACQQFEEAANEIDSLRAVELCTQHPAKMWRIEGGLLHPVLANPDTKGTPWHSTPYQALPKIYVQNASLEIAHCTVPIESGTIAGKVILPFITTGYEGFDINLPEDWIVAEHLIQTGAAILPPTTLENING
jgi:CMP-N,N'-diacetyllegionaminic acid synthase